MTASDVPLCSARARLIGERMTNPESQKTGIPVMYPMQPTASTLCCFPTIFRMKFAIVRAAPVFSRIVPIIVPHRMTIPMLVMMLPNPDLTVLTTVTGSMPQTRPTRSAITTITMNGCSLSFEIASTIRMTETTIRAKRKNVSIFAQPPLTKFIH